MTCALSVLVLLRPAVLFFDLRLRELSLFGQLRACSVAYELGIRSDIAFGCKVAW